MSEIYKTKAFSSNQIDCSGCNLKKYRPIVDRLLQQFETYDKLKSLDVVTFAKQTFEQLNQLEAENKKLKELVKTRIEDLCDSCGASSMMPMPCKVYEQALQEIKKIAEDDCKTCTVKLLVEYEINCKRCYKTKILQKCEVIKDEV